MAAENAQHARLLKLTEENRLYDMMEAQTARQIAMLQERLTELKKTDDPAQAERLLGQIIVIGTYIKRRNNLIFVGVQRGSISRAGAAALPERVCGKSLPVRRGVLSAHQGGRAAFH